MKIALVDTKPIQRNPLYSVALLKIGAYLMAEGHYVRLYRDCLPRTRVDEIWASTTFTFDIPHALAIVEAAKRRADVVRVGGVAASLIPEPFRKAGAKVHIGLHAKAEGFSPDYSLLPEEPDYSVTHITRGCIRRCAFCMVHRLEPKFKERKNWKADVNPKASHLLLYDNNWLAQKPAKLKDDVDQLKWLIASTALKTVDFNQAIDCRLMTAEKADILRGLPLNPVRFAFDGMHEDGHYQKAVKLMAERGHKEFNALMLYNFEDKPEDFYYRLRENVRLKIDLGVQMVSVPMRYHPVLTAHLKRDFIGKHWTRAGVKGFKSILNAHSISGQVSCKGGNCLGPMEEFEYFFGSDAREFVKLINYPDIKSLSNRRKGALRQQRADAREVKRGKGAK